MKESEREAVVVGLDFISYQDEISVYRVARSLHYPEKVNRLTLLPAITSHPIENSDEEEMVRNFRVYIV